MYRPCLHCKSKEDKKYGSDICPQICTYGEDRKELKILELENDKLKTSLERAKVELATVKNPNADINTHVYCTKCVSLRLDDENIPYCGYVDICNINNCEDSMPLSERPMYKEK